MPYGGLTLDRQLGYRHALEIPAQPGTIANTLFAEPDNTHWGAELGLDILTGSSARLGMRAHYQASADTRIVGGNVFARIPLWGLALRDLRQRD